jgi:hypothetical protein
MIELRSVQRGFAGGLLAEETTDLWEPWVVRRQLVSVMQ